jgi:hypothetical protein
MELTPDEIEQADGYQQNVYSALVSIDRVIDAPCPWGQVVDELHPPE